MVEDGATLALTPPAAPTGAPRSDRDAGAPSVPPHATPSSRNATKVDFAAGEAGRGAVRRTGTGPGRGSVGVTSGTLRQGIGRREDLRRRHPSESVGAIPRSRLFLDDPSGARRRERTPPLPGQRRRRDRAAEDAGPTAAVAGRRSCRSQSRLHGPLRACPVPDRPSGHTDEPRQENHDPPNPRRTPGPGRPLPP